MWLNKAKHSQLSSSGIAKILHKNKPSMIPHAFPSTITKQILKQKQGEKNRTLRQ